MKNEKGITLITLVVTIIVILILAGVATYSGTESIRQAGKTAFISQMEMIQAKVNVIYEKRKTSTEELEYYNGIGRDISTVNETKLATVLGETSKEGFRYFKPSDLELLEIEDINQEVIINYDTREVISLTGIEIDGVMYYKLRDIPNYLGYNTEYTNSNTEAPTFTVEQVKVDETTYKFTLKDIVYNSNVSGGTVSYKLSTDRNWILNGTSTTFIVTKPGIYDIKLTDSAGNSSTVQRWVYVQNGILAYYDGENNTGNGHNNTATEWKDLSGNGYDASLTNINYTDDSGWKENAIQIDGVDDKIIFPVTRPEAGTFSVEIIFTEQNYEKTTILWGDKGWSNFLAHTYNGDGSIYIGGNYALGKNLGKTDRFTPEEIDFKTTIGKTDSIVYTYNGVTRQATFYANGKKIAQKTYTTDPEEIGHFKIEENAQKMYSRISFYDRVLVEDEVMTNFVIDQHRFNITTE